MMQQQNKGAVGGRKLTSRRLATGQVSILYYYDDYYYYNNYY